MSRVQILLTIEPQDDERCGECRGVNVPRADVLRCPWAHWHDGDDESYFVRGPLCLAAERKLRAIVEAGYVLAMRLLQQGSRDAEVAARDLLIAEHRAVREASE